MPSTEAPRAITPLPFGLPGAVYRSPLPFGQFDPGHAALAEWQQFGVRVVYSLINADEWGAKALRDSRREITAAGIRRIDFPIDDFWVPRDAAAFQAAAADALRTATTGDTIAVHCNAGWGRTGMFLVEMAIQHFGFDVPQAVAWVRQAVPPAVENQDQYQFLLGLHPPQ
jgi:protein-tyrosine phosphatase